MRPARMKLAAFVVVALTAGVLPWATDGPAAAKGLAVPFLIMAAFAAVVALRLPQATPAASAAYPPAQPGGCACGSGGCCSAAAAPCADPADR